MVPRNVGWPSGAVGEYGSRLICESRTQGGRGAVVDEALVGAARGAIVHRRVRLGCVGGPAGRGRRCAGTDQWFGAILGRDCGHGKRGIRMGIRAFIAGPLGHDKAIKADAAGCRVCRGGLVAWGWRRLACGRDGGRWKAAWQDAMGRVRVEERARGAGWACGAQVPETAGAGRVVPRPARASSAAPQRRRRSVVSQLMQGSVMETP